MDSFKNVIDFTSTTPSEYLSLIAGDLLEMEIQRLEVRTKVRITPAHKYNLQDEISDDLQENDRTHRCGVSPHPVE
jgi:hypothetical protein